MSISTLPKKAALAPSPDALINTDIDRNTDRNIDRERNFFLTGKSRPTYALISEHGDPAASLGKDGAGGQNVYVREVGLSLARQGYQVDMFTRREDPDQPAIVQHAPGCRTIRLNAGPAEFIHRNDMFEYMPAFIDAWHQFRQETGTIYDVIHTHYWMSGWVGLQLSQQLDIPLVHTYHSVGAVKFKTTQEQCAIASTRLQVERQILERADCVVATSPQEMADLRHLVSPQGNIEIIPCGTDVRKFGAFNRVTARELLGIEPDTNMILYVGRFDPRKGIETLVRACAQMPKPFTLYLVGGSREANTDDAEQQRIRNLVNELGLADVIVFTGQVPQSELPPYYAAADVCVVPSHYEPFGLVAIEAMVAGTPVIASDVGGLQFTVQSGKTGILVPPCDPVALANALQELFSNPTRRLAYGAAARERVLSNFSWDAVGKQLQSLYNSLSLAKSTGINWLKCA